MDSITLGERLRDLIKERGLDHKEVAKILEIKRTTFSGYVRNFREPNIKTLKALANYFNVTVDYLIGNSNERNPNYDHLTEELNIFVRNPENVMYIEVAKDIKTKTNIIKDPVNPIVNLKKQRKRDSSLNSSNI